MPPTPELIDTHCHLAEPKLANQLSLILKDSHLAGVSNFICNTTNQTQWQSCINISKRFPQVVPCLGIHPWFISTADDNWQIELQNLLSKNLAAIGEIGLDCWKNPEQIDLQIDIFKDQIEIAAAFNLPVSVHCLKAWNQMQKVLRSSKILPKRIHFHAFNAPENIIPELVEAGYYFSIAPDILKNNREKQLRKIKLIPLDKIFIETDSPDMLLANIDKLKRKYNLTYKTSNNDYNSPANLLIFAKELAIKLNIDFFELAKITTNNAKRFWKEFLLT